MLRPALIVAALAFTGGAAFADPVAPATAGASNLNGFVAQTSAPPAQAVAPAPQPQAAAPVPPARPAVAKKRVAKKVVRPAPVQVVMVAPVQSRVSPRMIQFPTVGTGF